MVGDYERWQAFREREEGGWSNDPADHGGETMYGISRVSHPGIPWPPTREAANEIARTEYWTRLGCQVWPWPLNAAVADAGFNSGPRRAVDWLAQVVKAEPVWPIVSQFEDGVLHACAERGTSEIANAFHLRRVDFLCELVKHDSSQLKFLKGWMRRCIRLQQMMGD